MSLDTDDEKVRYLWAVIDRTHSILWHKSQAYITGHGADDLTDAERRIMEACQFAMNKVKFPGETDEKYYDEV